MQVILRSGTDVAPPIAVSLAGFAAAQYVPLTRFAYLFCGDRGLAEDLVQDAFVSLYRRFGDTLPLAAPVSHARRAIVNAGISRGRRRSSRETVLADVPDTPSRASTSASRTRCGACSRTCRTASARCSSCATTSI